MTTSRSLAAICYLQFSSVGLGQVQVRAGADVRFPWACRRRRASPGFLVSLGLVTNPAPPLEFPRCSGSWVWFYVVVVFSFTFLGSFSPVRDSSK